MWNVYQEHFGKNLIEDEETVFLKGPSLLMNPTLKKATVQKAYDRDPVVASSEFGASFRESIGGYVNSTTLKKVTVKDRKELHYNSFSKYIAAADLSAGVSENSDDASAVIGYVKKSLIGAPDKLIICKYLHYNAPFNPDYVIKKMSELLREFKIKRIHADNYASQFQSRLWGKNRIKHIPIKRNKTEIYADLLGMISSGSIELLDDPELLTQAMNLQRKTVGGGREIIDHISGADDALINSIGILASISLRPVFKVGAVSFENRDEALDKVEKIFNQN